MRVRALPYPQMSELKACGINYQKQVEQAHARKRGSVVSLPGTVRLERSLRRMVSSKVAPN